MRATDFLAIIIYFGALALPALYFVFTGWRGSAKKKMLIGAACQLFVSSVVYWLGWYLCRVGYQEGYWAIALWIPVNAIALIWYLASILTSKKKEPNQQPEPMRMDDCSTI